MKEDVKNLVGSIIQQEDPTIIISLGRKAAFLIIDQLERLEKNGFHMQKVRKNRLDFSFIHDGLPREKPVIIVVDSIHNGLEICDALEFLGAKNVAVKRIYCYIAAEEGLAKLEERGYSSSELVVSLYSSSTEDEYDKYFARLNFYFHAKIEPMNPTQYYDTYNVDSKISKDELMNVLKMILREIGQVEVEFIVEDESGFPSNVWMITSKIDDYSFAMNLVREQFPANFDYSVNFVQVCSKVRKQWASCDFTIILDTDMKCDTAAYGDPAHCKIHGDALCKSLEKLNSNQIEALCYECASQIVSDKILSEINQRIFDAFKKLGYVCKMTDTYR